VKRCLPVDFSLTSTPENLFFIANISGEIMEIDPKARQALNFIETGNDNMCYY
jgi:hypothetical protein